MLTYVRTYVGFTVCVFVQGFDNALRLNYLFALCVV
ncbi:hypothetical protein MGSAQ_000504 [marine sediment metagenome]|uniref:Uncharacterized protein n=1 Tax=marine sediment metagenome TaxID=412755 RepID=A0A1B6NX16_9ZZZZ